MSDTRQSTDPLAPLLERYLLSGDEEAMDRVVAATREKLLGVARRIGAPQDAEDAVQGAYLSLLRKRGTGLEAPVLPWLMTTVIRLAYRRKAVQARQRDLARRLAQPRELSARESRTPDTIAVQAESGELVRSSVAKLPRVYRDAVVLRELEGLETRDVATLLDVSETTVRTRLHRAAKLLRSKVAPALMALLLFLPWCAADAWRGFLSWSRPLLLRPHAGAALLGGVLVAAVGLTWLLPDARDPEAAPREAPAPAGDGPKTRVVPPAPPEPGPAPERPASGAFPGGGAGPVGPGSESGSPVGRRPPSDSPVGPGAPAAGPEQRQRDPSPALPSQAETVAAGNRRPLPPAPAGMVALEGGHVPIGTTPAEFDELMAGRADVFRDVFRPEVPRHTRFLTPYYIGTYEVTNAQYLRFLEDQRVEVQTGQSNLESLDAIAAHLVGMSDEERKHPKQNVWLQLYRANKGAIWRAFGKRASSLMVWRKDHTVDEMATALRMRHEPLPAGLTLTFFGVRPPRNWPDMRPPADQWDHPVRFVSYLDAAHCAEWAGLHVPTEQEWEWAARGPDARRFPWGDTWPKDASRANWGGKVTGADHEPTTLPVDSRGEGSPDPDSRDGRSWCGLHHMSGNVAEWTSSWFAAYPESAAANPYMGRYVKVIRGGGAGDTEWLVLRPACRNYLGGGPSAPPYPASRFEWCGFRLAAYGVPGRDHVEPVLRRVTRPRKLKHADFAPERFAAMVTRNWAARDAQTEHHVYVLGRARAVVFAPLAAVLRDRGAGLMNSAFARPARFRSTQKLLAQSRDAAWPLGVLHTDLPLAGVEVPTQDNAPRKKSARGRRRAPPTEQGTVPPGTYVLALDHERLALYTPALEFVCFLSQPLGAARRPDDPSVEVRSHSSKQVGPPTQRLTKQAGEGLLDFSLPLGGRTSPGKWQVVVRARLPFSEGALTSPFEWLHSDAGR